LARKVFISKNASEVQDLKEHLEANGDQLIATSFLHFEQLEFEVESSFDVIFFGSPRAIIFFQARHAIPATALIACSGQKTGDLLRSIGHEVHFEAKKSGDMRAFADEFKKWCGDKHVLFPTSDLSLKTISSVFDDDQKTELVVYSTKIKGREVESSDTYVFTSPSNVKGFLEANQSVPEDSRVIAWGESTAAALTENSVTVDEILSVASVGSLMGLLGK